MRVVFMGTPDFAVSTLEAIINAGHEVLMVVTQPDKAKGRGKKVIYTPVKEKALEYHIRVEQPEKVKEEAFVNLLEELNPDVIVVVAFGQILSERILNIPKYGCINVHASLLPAYRGAAPIQWAILDGLKETGVTTMYMEKGLDTGDIICQSKIKIDDKETGGTLFDRLAVDGANLLISTLEKLQDGTAVRTKQDNGKSTYAKMLTKNMGKIDFSSSAIVLERLIRGLNPWPSAFSRLDDKNIKIFETEIINESVVEELINSFNIKDVIPGMVIDVDKKSFTVKCGEGALKILNLQLEGKKRMDTSAFLLGYKVQVGMVLGI